MQRLQGIKNLSSKDYSREIIKQNLEMKELNGTKKKKISSTMVIIGIKLSKKKIRKLQDLLYAKDHSSFVRNLNSCERRNLKKSRLARDSNP